MKPLTTTTEFANMVIARMCECNIIDRDEFEYISNSYINPEDIADIEFSVYGELSYGASEGIYLRMYAFGDYSIDYSGNKRSELCTFKILQESDENMRRLGVVMADFIIISRKLLEENSEIFIRRGYNMFNKEGKAVLWVQSLERAKKHCHEKGYKAYDCYNQKFVA